MKKIFVLMCVVVMFFVSSCGEVEDGAEDYLDDYAEDYIDNNLDSEINEYIDDNIEDIVDDYKCNEIKALPGDGAYLKNIYENGDMIEQFMICKMINVVFEHHEILDISDCVYDEIMDIVLLSGITCDGIN